MDSRVTVQGSVPIESYSRTLEIPEQADNVGIQPEKASQRLQYDMLESQADVQPAMQERRAV